jgi:hypothetical protein
MMTDRKEVANSINDFFEKGGGFKEDDKRMWHIGLVELRQIMDLVYGGPPNSDEEKLNKPSWR